MTQQMKGENQDGNTALLSVLVVLLVVVFAQGVGLAYLYSERETYKSVETKLDGGVLSSASSPTPAPFVPTPQPDLGLIDEEFSFPVPNTQSELARGIDYRLVDYEISDEIVVAGETATAVPGRAFLVVNIEVTNNTGFDIDVDSSDYVRLVLDGDDGAPVAADVHNDPLSIPPRATRKARLGFAIDEEESGFILSVGASDTGRELVRLDD